MDDVVTAVSLSAGERTVVRLPGAATAGYRWTHCVGGDAEAIVVSIGTAPPAEIAGRPPGPSADRLVVIEARHPGRATVTLEQRRPWESTPEPEARRVLRISVT